MTLYDWDEIALELSGWLPNTFHDAIKRNMTIDTIVDWLDVSRRQVAYQAIAHHRNYLDDDNRALLTACIGRSYYVYWVSVDPTEIAAYIGRRIDGDMTSRVFTLQAQAERAEALTDARTIAGKRAKLTKRYINRLVEDLADLQT